ncbi:cobyrinic acid A,C-diamide synthase [Polychytrium aggregatum]|uniref:cobyrinic acid A,C-diamide synthase n=1 Tax=Polychytrium aggregatum TaxID=110093 RepID=UPI0022FECC76|nr:cobyrinic acid A,C-diamide synthase [Polychytrium aggregatum]KAI9190753.1 cobyrinic acid A,C-diamide synthase [Polychytrium aggregatum]
MPSRPQRALVVAAPSSGSGKTSVTLGLINALTRRGLRVQPFKVGPDFIDPLHHTKAVSLASSNLCGDSNSQNQPGCQSIQGEPNRQSHRDKSGRHTAASFNLDGWMLSKETALRCFQQNSADADISIIEGVMGLFDGRDGKTETGSTAEMAKWLGAPVVLVLDCWALSRSVAAFVKGFAEFDPELNLAGVVLNRTGGDIHTTWLKDAIHTYDPAVHVFGGIPRESRVQIPERHLGLHLPTDFQSTEYINKLGDLIEKHLDLDQLLEVSVLPDLDLVAEIEHPLAGSLAPVRIGVAKDEAFCFYYQDNISLLARYGATIVFFSPIHDACLPTDIDGLYFGGGYPELHAKQLSDNHAILEAVKTFPGCIYGECGGLMYLAKTLSCPTDMAHPTETDRATYPMSGVWNGAVAMTKKMEMSYVQVTSKSPLFGVGEQARGHVFHFSSVIENNEPEHAFSMEMQRPGSTPVLAGIQVADRVVASYVHLHWGSNPVFARNFVAQCHIVKLRPGSPDEPQVELLPHEAPTA